MTLNDSHAAECPAPSDLMGAVGGLMNQLYGAVWEETEPIKPWEFVILRAFLARDSWTSSQLGTLYPSNPARINRLVNKLVKSGLIGKSRSATDRRVVHLRLTKEGRRTLNELLGRATALDAKLTAGITPEEMAAFQSTIRKIKENYTDMKRAEFERITEAGFYEVPFY